MNQRPLFSGLNCLPGQQDLFGTDGTLPDARQACAACGEPVPVNDDWPFVGSDRSRYCGAACRDAGERELIAMRLPRETPADELTVTRQPGPKWWIVGTLEGAPAEFGPYPTKAEAAEDRIGLLRTYRAKAKGLRSFHRFVTTE